MSVFANILAKALDFSLLLFPFSWKYAGILLSSMFKTYGAPSICSSPKRNDQWASSARPSHFFIARISPQPKSVVTIKDIAVIEALLLFLY